MTRAAAIEWAAKGVSVHVVSPGAVETDMFGALHRRRRTAKAEFQSRSSAGGAAPSPTIANCRALACIGMLRRSLLGKPRR